MFDSMMNQRAAEMSVEVFDLEPDFVGVGPIIITFQAGDIFAAAGFKSFHRVSARADIFFAEGRLDFVGPAAVVILDNFDCSIGGTIVSDYDFVIEANLLH